MVIYAQDPSFQAWASSIWDGDSKIYINKFSHPLGEGIGFDKILTASRELWDMQHSYIDSLIKDGCISEITHVFSEFPPPVGNFAAGLYGLDTFVISKLYDTYETVRDVYGFSPSYLQTVHSTKNYSKSDSTRLAKYFMNEVLQNDFEFVIPDNVSDTGRRTKGTMNNDKAESFLFLLRAFVKYDVKGLGQKISLEMSGLGIEAEKLLLERSI